MRNRTERSRRALWLIAAGTVVGVGVLGAVVAATRGGDGGGATSKAVSDVRAWVARCPKTARFYGFRPEGATTVGATGDSSLVTVALPYRAGNNFYLDVDTLTGTVALTSNTVVQQTTQYYPMFWYCVGEDECAHGHPTHGETCTNGTG